jgi:uncharacterized coiled-coil DUF342 family protein
MRYFMIGFLKREIDGLRPRIDELITKCTAAADEARVIGEEIRKRTGHAEQGVAALHARIFQLETKCTAVARKCDEEAAKLAERDKALSEKIASLTDQFTEIEKKFSVNFEELGRRLGATKVVVPQPMRDDLQAP